MPLFKTIWSKPQKLLMVIAPYASPKTAGNIYDLKFEGTFFKKKYFLNLKGGKNFEISAFFETQKFDFLRKELSVKKKKICHKKRT